MAEKAVNNLVENIEAGGCVDEHMQDQVIIFMALAQGHSRIRTGPLTLHTETSIHFTQLMTGVCRWFMIVNISYDPGTIHSDSSNRCAKFLHYRMRWDGLYKQVTMICDNSAINKTMFTTNTAPRHSIQCHILGH